MIIACPQCGRKLQVEEAQAGRPVRCPGCQNTFNAPAAAPVAEVVAPVPVAASPVGPKVEAVMNRVAGYAKLAKPLIVLGLILVVVSRGCDTLGARGVLSTSAKVTQAQNDFEARWDKNMQSKVLERGDVNEKLHPRRGADGKVPEVSPEDMKNYQEKLDKIDQNLSDMQADKDKEETKLRAGDWAGLINAARSASSSYEYYSYWYTVAFLVGTIVLLLGLLGLAFGATTLVERILSLGMIGIIVSSIYIGGVAWFSSVATDVNSTVQMEKPMPRSTIPRSIMPGRIGMP
jgi:predicted Zn finger-like uncharacterized protein